MSKSDGTVFRPYPCRSAEFAPDEDARRLGGLNAARPPPSRGRDRIGGPFSPPPLRSCGGVWRAVQVHDGVVVLSLRSGSQKK
jgi:hypothetical protein